MSRGPRIHPEFPIRENLSPPFLDPVSDCAEAVSVSAFLPRAIVRVWAGGTELLAEEQPEFSFAVIKLKRPVVKGESLTTTQEAAGQQSLHLVPPVIVAPLDDSAVRNTKPDVGDDLYECGFVVPVGNLVPGGVRVHVVERDPAPGGVTKEVGNEPAAQAWHPVVTFAGLHADHLVLARQAACEGSDHEVSGPPSDEVKVKPAPSPTPAPTAPDPKELIPGDTAVPIYGLFVGAAIEVFDSGNLVATGKLATASANLVPVWPPLTGGPVTATQKLCGPPSQPSRPVVPEGRLTPLSVLEPICAGSHFVVVRGSRVNALVVVFKNGTPVGYAGGKPGDLFVPLDATKVLNPGDIVTARQYVDPVVNPTLSPPSNDAHVVGLLHQPVIEILGGEPFFEAGAKDEPIDGPVFPRGRGAGPRIRVQACCSKEVRLQIVGPDSSTVADPPLKELFPGYFEGIWPWTSHSRWAVPGGIQVGRYMAVVRTGCQQEQGRKPFYVIFNPADVGGPPRFSFDDTAVWFGTGSNSVHGLHYFLRQSDNRVFSRAINAVNGAVDSHAAAIQVARMEEALFAYVLTYHTNDVVELLTKFTEAQCADDACCLTAFLRAVGIPAHPVTADAALETGDGNWTFDTWVEFLSPNGGVTDWRIFHPHQYKGMAPETRATFGTARGVALVSFNDVIVMANEGWVAADLDDGTMDVTYGRNQCGQPHQHLNKAGWIDEICEQGYWSKAHWDCTGVRPRSLVARDGFRLHGGAPAFSAPLSGTVSLVNPTEERLFGRLVVELVASRPESKAFAELSLGEAAEAVALDPGEAITVPFRFHLPPTLPPGVTLYLRCRLGERTAALQELRIPPRVHLEVDVPRRFLEGEEAKIRATVRNVTTERLTDVAVDLAVPFALEARDQIPRRFEVLGPRETREVAWTVRAVAHLRSGSAHVSVATADGGGVLVRRPFAIKGVRRPGEEGPTVAAMTLPDVKR